MKMMFKQSASLPVAFPLRQSQMPVYHVDRTVRCVDDRHLSTAWLFRLPGQRDLMVAKEWPAREQQVTVSTGLNMNIELVHPVWKFQSFSE